MILPLARPLAGGLVLALFALPALLDTQSELRPKPQEGAADVGDPYYPGVGNGGYDVQHYDVRLEVDMETGYVDAWVEVRALATQALSSFHLDLVGLEVLEVRVGGKPAPHRREGRELIVTPKEPLAAAAEFLVAIEYRGIPGPAPDAAVAAMGIPGTGWFRQDSGIYVVSECVGAAGWLPCNDHPTDKATFTFLVTVPAPYVVAANGLLVEESEKDDLRTYVWQANDPMATYLATIDIARFDVRVEEGPGGIPLRLYYPVDATERELAAFENTAEMIEYFSSQFGPYPFESFGGVLSYESIGGALETQTLPVYSRRTSEGTVAHELAHQWFGDCVSAAGWQHMWLNEGFAVFAEWMWRGYAEGPEAVDEAARRAYRFARRVALGSPADPGVGEVFSPRTYQRGALALYALRREVGEETFLAILRRWLVDHHDGSATTEEFAALSSEVAKRDLSEWFAVWVFGDVVPEDDPLGAGEKRDK